MNERKLVPYLKELGRNLRVNPFRRRRILLEVRDHLLRTVEQERAAGADPDWAQEAAIAEFGDPASAAHRFTPASPDSTPYYYGSSYRPGIPNPTAAVTRRRQSKTVTLAFGGIALVLFLIIAALALVFIPPSPPTISEFQPQAEQQIEEAPLQQSSRFGSGEGGLCAAGQECEGESQPATPTKRVIEKARVRRCLGDPPRQTEDPQSPPCVNFWEGDNGGATWKGVTRDEIRIAVPDRTTQNSRRLMFDALSAHFKTRYEFYGRKLRFFDVGRMEQNVSFERAAANKVAKELSAFASIHPTVSAGNSYSAYRRELTRLGVMSIFGFSLLGIPLDFLEQHSPYAWDYDSPLYEVQRNLAEFACKTLVGRPARYAGVFLKEQERRFAAVYTRLDSRENPESLPLRRGLESCGASLEVAESPNNQANRLAILADFRARSITTIVALDGDIAMTGRWFRDASSQNYFPEWVLVGAQQDDEAQWITGPPEQRMHTYGVVPWNKFLRASDKPTVWAAKEGDPSAEGVHLETSPTEDDYHALLLLASGIQMAGPNLTPNSFALGLEQTMFANPEAGRLPYFQAHVGLTRSDHSMTNDFAVVWWNDAAPTYHGSLGQSERGGGFCWLGKGRRWSLGRWPKEDLPLFDLEPQNCR